MGNIAGKRDRSSFEAKIVPLGSCSDTVPDAHDDHREAQRVQRVEEARAVLEVFRVRRAARLQEVSRLRDTSEERHDTRAVDENGKSQDEAKRAQQAQQVYDAQQAATDVRVNRARLALEDSRSRQREAFETFHGQRLPKRARTTDRPEDSLALCQPQEPPAPLGRVEPGALAARLKSAETAEAEASAFAEQVRRDVFRLKHENLIDEKIQQLMSRHADRIYNEAQRVKRGDTVAPVEYILLVHAFIKKQSSSSCTVIRVLVGDCNVTFATYPTAHRLGFSGENWESQWVGVGCKFEVPWEHWNRLDAAKNVNLGADSGPSFATQGHTVMPAIDLDFQDDVFLLPHFRDVIAAHLKIQSIIHNPEGRKTSRDNFGNVIGVPFAIGCSPKLDRSFDETLNFLAMIKRLNRLEFETISSRI